jgi:peptidoglycan/xylan/chitin deacetylase (PgdA/CDA1 family)
MPGHAKMRSHVVVGLNSAASQAEYRVAAYKTVARFVKLVGSLIWHIGTVIWRTMRQLQGKPIPGSLVVLCYHAIPQNQRARFGRQMDLLRQYTKPTRADVETPLLAGERYAAVTFDDGYQSTVENALPELKARNIPCTLFVVSHLPGHSPWWSGTEGYDREDKFVTAEQLVNLPSELVTIGSHTMTHPNLAVLSEEMAKRELFESRQLLQQTLRREIRLFAFPHGAFNDALVTWCREAGYQRVFSGEPTMTFSNVPEYVTGRVIVDPTDWDLEFRLKVLGAYQWLPVAYGIKRKVRTMLQRI